MLTYLYVPNVYYYYIEENIFFFCLCNDKLKLLPLKSLSVLECYDVTE